MHVVGVDCIATKGVLFAFHNNIRCFSCVWDVFAFSSSCTLLTRQKRRPTNSSWKKEAIRFVLSVETFAAAAACRSAKNLEPFLCIFVSEARLDIGF